MRLLGVLVFIVGSLSFIACSGSSSPSLVAPDALGPFAVGHSSFELEDAARDDRPLLVDVWYPVDAADAQDGPMTEYLLLDPIGLPSRVAVDDLPVSARSGQTLLIFSHGYQGIHIQSTGLMEDLASHGFIVASAEHTGNAQASPDDSFDEAAANRVPDVSFLIDSMIARNQDPADPFYGRIDEDAVGVVGHSFGAMTAIGAASSWAGSGPDPRVAAIAPISAVIDGDLQSDEREGPNAGFTAEQLARIAVPVLLLGGTEDINVPIGNNALAFEQMVNAPRVYKVDIIGATHNHFAAICPIANALIDFGLSPDVWPAIGAGDLVEPYETTCGPEVFPAEEGFRLQSLFVVAFFKSQMLDDSRYESYLSPNFANTEPSVAITLR
jgi:predicted dienelactone hydrolase